jgi:hypothetical protein
MAHVDNTRNTSSSRDEPVGRVNTDRDSTESSARPADTLALKVLIGIVVVVVMIGSLYLILSGVFRAVPG